MGDNPADLTTALASLQDYYSSWSTDTFSKASQLVHDFPNDLKTVVALTLSPSATLAGHNATGHENLLHLLRVLFKTRDGLAGAAPGRFVIFNTLQAVVAPAINDHSLRITFEPGIEYMGGTSRDGDKIIKLRFRTDDFFSDDAQAAGVACHEVNHAVRLSHGVQIFEKDKDHPTAYLNELLGYYVQQIAQGLKPDSFWFNSVHNLITGAPPNPAYFHLKSFDVMQSDWTDKSNIARDVCSYLANGSGDFPKPSIALDDPIITDTHWFSADEHFQGWNVTNGLLGSG